MTRLNINFGDALWWCNWQIRDPSDDEIGAPWWPDGEIGDPRPLVLETAYYGSIALFQMYVPQIWEILDVMQAEKECMEL